jgi:hypothetical protein
MIHTDSKEARILNQPTEQAERTDPQAVNPKMKNGKDEDKGHDDGRRHPKIPFEEFEGIEVAVNRLISETRNPAKDKNQETDEKDKPKAVAQPEGRPLPFDFGEHGKVIEQLMEDSDRTPPTAYQFDPDPCHECEGQEYRKGLRSVRRLCRSLPVQGALSQHRQQGER